MTVRQSLTLSLLLGGTVLGSPAWAQAVGAPGTASPSQAADAASQPTERQVEGGLGDIIVTAERRETNLQNTPIAITAVTSGALEAQGIANINELGASVPNLTTTSGPQGSADANFFVRGVGQFDFIATNDPGVGVYVDGVYLGRTVGALIDSANIERVEVLRGPQGTLFGRNTLGGAVSITSKAPETTDFSGYLRGTFGSRSRVDVDAGLNLPLSDTAALRVSAFQRYQDGFATRVFDGVRFGKTKRYGGQAALLLKPNENLTINLKADYSNDKSNPAPSKLIAIAPLPFFPADAGNDRSSDFYTVFESNSPESSNEIYGFSGTIAYDFGGVTAKSITAYRHLDALSTSDPDGTGYRLYDQFSPTLQNQFSQEFQLTGDAFDDKLNFVAGVYYFRERVEQALNLCFAPITPLPRARFNACNTWVQANDQRTDSLAAFGQARFKLSDVFSLTAGGRYTIETKRNISNQFFDFRPAGFSPAPGVVVPGFVAPIVTDLPGRVQFRKFTPKVGFEITPVDSRVLIFGSYSEGFRSGGFNGRLIAPQPTIPTYAPDTNTTFELGIKSDFLDRRVRLNATGFYSRYQGIQQTISDPTVQFRVANAGKATLYGFEIELTALPTEGLLLNAAIGYTKSEFVRDDGQNGPVDPSTGIAFGNKLPFSPELTASVGVEYAIPIGEGKLTPRADFRYQSRTFFSPFNLPFEQQGGYGLLDARITYTAPDDRFTIAAFGKNLTDKEYFTFGQNALAAQGVAYNYIGRPREYGVTASVRF